MNRIGLIQHVEACTRPFIFSDSSIYVLLLSISQSSPPCSPVEGKQIVWFLLFIYLSGRVISDRQEMSDGHHRTGYRTFKCGRRIRRAAHQDLQTKPDNRCWAHISSRVTRRETLREYMLGGGVTKVARIQQQQLCTTFPLTQTVSRHFNFYCNQS